MNSACAASTGERLSEKMRELGVSKNMLAKRTGLDRSTIVRLCSGNEVGMLYTWKAISDALGVSISELVGDVDGR